MKKVYSRTPKLTSARFRGQRAFVVEALSQSSTPIALEDLLPLVDKNGRYSALLNTWAMENGGIKGSIRYHLRALKGLGMVEEATSLTPARTQLVSWGNSHALRVPKAMLDELQIREGDEVEMIVQDGQLTVKPVNTKLTLESLVEGITPENRHKEIDWGKPAGGEVW